MKSLKYLFALLLFVGLVACTSENQAEEPVPEVDDSRMVSFKGRTIDLTPYIEGFPYSGFTPFYAAGKMYYMERGATTDLLELDLSGDTDLTKGKRFPILITPPEMYGVSGTIKMMITSTG